MTSVPRQVVGTDTKWALIMCGTAAVLFSLMSVDAAVGCNAYNVKLYVAETQADAESSTEKELTVECGTAYWVRVKWSESGSDDDFDVEVYDGTEDGTNNLIASESGIADEEDSSTQSVCLKVDTTPYSGALNSGEHSIYAKVRRDEMGWEPEENESDNKCTVYQAEFGWLLNDDSGTWRPGDVSVCKGDSVDFKAVLIPDEASFPENKPVWGGEASGKSPGSNPVTVTFNDVGTKTVSAQCYGTTVSVTVYVKDGVEFLQYTAGGGQKYGFDNFSNADKPWKSVEEDDDDHAKARITRTPVSSVYFKSDNTTNVELLEPGSPYNASYVE
ncbi:MAG: hypothetical protein ACYS29_10510, partial [Planctomycetota bacterium]